MNLIIGVGIILLGIADAYTTHVALSQGASEANPIVLYLMDNLPGDTWIVAKLIVHTVVGLLIFTNGNLYTVLRWPVLAVLVWYGIVITNNLLVIVGWL